LNALYEPGSFLISSLCYLIYYSSQSYEPVFYLPLLRHTYFMSSPRDIKACLHCCRPAVFCYSRSLLPGRFSPWREDRWLCLWRWQHRSRSNLIKAHLLLRIKAQGMFLKLAATKGLRANPFRMNPRELRLGDISKSLWIIF
jgi:hypothetical protein